MIGSFGRKVPIKMAKGPVNWIKFHQNGQRPEKGNIKNVFKHDVWPFIRQPDPNEQDRAVMDLRRFQQLQRRQKNLRLKNHIFVPHTAYHV